MKIGRINFAAFVNDLSHDKRPVLSVPHPQTRFEGTSFEGQDLRGKDLSGSIYLNCNFDNADLTEANCSRCDFTCSSFRHTLLTRTNFAQSKLACTVFEPNDCYGMTITLECRTFQNATIGQIHWYSWLMFLASMMPVAVPVKDNLRDNLVALIGAERYVKLKAMFARREL